MAEGAGKGLFLATATALVIGCGGRVAQRAGTQTDAGSARDASASAPTPIVDAPDALTDTTADTGEASDVTANEVQAEASDVTAAEDQGEAAPDMFAPPEASCDAATCLTALTIGVGGAASCALFSDAHVYCWGNNSLGQLGNTTAGGTMPVPVQGLSGATTLATGGDHACAVLVDGTLWCWGSFGIPEEQDGGPPDTMVPVQMQGITTPKAIATGGSIACAVLADGTVRCWGYANGSLLGDGSMNSSVVPVEVSGITDATGISVGGTQACVLRSGGSVRCWGANEDGQLGDGTTNTQATPVDVEGLTNVVSLAAGEYHTCALVTGGAVKCWGRNDSGQLGIGSSDGPDTCFRSCSLAPVTVPGLSGVVALSAGYDITCAVLGGGDVQCWGRNPWGQLGNGSSLGPETCASLDPCAASPTAVSISSTVAVAAGDHSCAILIDGGVQCWGSDQWGELGYSVGLATCGGSPCSPLPGAVNW